MGIRVRKVKDVQNGEELFLAYDENLGYRELIGVGETREEALDNLMENACRAVGGQNGQK